MISIGEVLGEPEQDGTPIDSTIRAAMRAAIKMREQFETAQTPGINVVFHVPGRLLAPDWSELRIERFSRKKQLLLVSVPVPQEIIGSDLSLIHRFVVESLRSASNLALEVFHDKGIAFPIADAEKLFAQTDAAL